MFFNYLKRTEKKYYKYLINELKDIDINIIVRIVKCNHEVYKVNVNVFYNGYILNNYGDMCVSLKHEMESFIEPLVNIIKNDIKIYLVTKKYPYLESHISYNDEKGEIRFRNMDLKRVLLYLESIKDKEFYNEYRNDVLDYFKKYENVTLDSPVLGEIETYDSWEKRYNNSMLKELKEAKIKGQVKVNIPLYEAILIDLNRKDISVNPNPNDVICMVNK